MRGPIDYIVVAFDGNNFKGEILKELIKARDSKIIDVLDISLITKSKDGEVSAIEISATEETVQKQLSELAPSLTGIINEDDVKEIGEILGDNCSAGLLVIEHLWAKGLKKAIVDAGGELIAEGRIHPEANEELNKKGGK